jgi:two-component system KDP operon response regulator KdpE
VDALASDGGYGHAAYQRERIVTYAALIKEVWGPERDDSRALRVYIGSLRRKLEIEPSRPKYILTELGIGYRLVMDAEPANDSSVN